MKFLKNSEGTISERIRKNQSNESSAIYNEEKQKDDSIKMGKV